MITRVISFVVTTAIDLTPSCMLDLAFGKKEEFDYKGSTTPDG